MVVLEDRPTGIINRSFVKAPIGIFLALMMVTSTAILTFMLASNFVRMRQVSEVEAETAQELILEELCGLGNIRIQDTNFFDVNRGIPCIQKVAT